MIPYIAFIMMYNIYPSQASEQERACGWDPRAAEFCHVVLTAPPPNASREVAEFTQTHPCSHRGNHYFVLNDLVCPLTW